MAIDTMLPAKNIRRDYDGYMPLGILKDNWLVSWTVLGR
jgi:hypothetical protein